MGIHGNVESSIGVARLDVGIVAADDHVAHGHGDRRGDIAFLPVGNGEGRYGRTGSDRIRCF